jgi:pilus assembly protein CpaC
MFKTLVCGQRSWCATALCQLAAICLIIAATGNGLLAQDSVYRERPKVPELEPRPLEGDAADQKLSTTRDPAERVPVAGFLKSIQGADANLEVILGQGKLLTTRLPIADEKGYAVVAVGDPSIIDFEVLPNPKMLRLIGKRPGVTDLSITTSDDQTHTFEVHVVYDLPLMAARVRHIFPDAEVNLTQLRGNLVLEGQARDIAQVALIEKTVRAYVTSLISRGSGGPMGPMTGAGPAPTRTSNDEASEEDPDAEGAQEPERLPPAATARAQVEPGQRSAAQGAVGVEIINLLRVPGIHQVMLQVQIGELNRTGLREMGADWFAKWGANNVVGTRISGSTLGSTSPQDVIGGLTGLNLGARSTGFGIFPSAGVAVAIRALRENSVLNILAEPNLMAMSGQEASFLAGGQFPVPVPQGGGITNQVTVQFKDFGVQLNFIPTVLDDETIRLKVAPEVSSIDFSLGTTLVQGGNPIPGLSTRRVSTTVELKQGHTLALAGLLQVELDGKTSRLPGLGDLPYLGPFFSNTSHKRVEKELLVLVTPCLVHSMTPDQVPPLPGTEIHDPNDREFYFLNRIEGRTGRPFRATMSWDNPLNMVEIMKLEQKYVSGAVGYSK